MQNRMTSPGVQRSLMRTVRQLSSIRLATHGARPLGVGRGPARCSRTVELPRLFSTSLPLAKKRKLAAPSNSPTWDEETPPPPATKGEGSSRKKSAAASTSSSSSSSSSSSASHSDEAGLADPENPLDLSVLTAAYVPADAHFKSQLQAITRGGRFNPDALGAFPVPVRGDDGATTSFALRELAQVVPRPGRALSLLVNDREYIKPIMSAVQASPEFNQQPQRAEDNELELVLKVEMERKEDVVRRVKEACHGWRDRVRQARTRHEKVVKGWQRDKVIRPDVGRLVEKEMQKMQDKKIKEIDQEETKTLRALERG